MKDERKSEIWMKQLDERLLEHLDEEGWATPSIMARSPVFTANEGQIRERCRKRQYIGFIDVIHGRMYEIDRDGQLYLDGRVDASYQPKPTVDRVLRGKG